MSFSKLNSLSYKIIGASYKVHSELGPGLLESTYETCLELLLLENGFLIERQKPMSIKFMNNVIENAYRADIIVENKIIVEIKSVEGLAPIHRAQIMTYLKLTNLKLGLLINFNVTTLKSGINRIVM